MNKLTTIFGQLKSVLVILVLVAFGCDTTDALQNYTGPLPGNTPIGRGDQVLETFPEVVFESGFYSLLVKPDGILRDGRWNPTPTVPDSVIQTMLYGGLWMGGYQDGRPRINLTWVGGPRSNFIPSFWREQPSSMYHFRPADVVGLPFNWPDSLGAIVIESGRPALFGDVETMGPTLSGSIPESKLRDSGFDSVQVVQTVFGYDFVRRYNAYFVRYDITNSSASDLSDLRLGIHTDTDLEWGRNHPCRSWTGYYRNGTGYDPDRQLTYTYHTNESGLMPPYCQGVVTGYSILQTIINGSTQVDVGSHRIYRRNRGREAGFSEFDFDNLDQLLLALEGLSTTGELMTNPATGEATKWAFTGNPVDSTGWLDYPTDVRSLLSTEAFELLSGDHVAITVMWVTTKRPDLGAAIDLMKETVDFAQSRPEIWGSHEFE